MRRIILIMLILHAAIGASAKPQAAVEPGDSVVALLTPIFGSPEADADRMYLFVKKRNANFTRDVAEAFLTIGARYGIRGDIALCQAILETGWFRFMDGTMVTPDQYNYGGLGVTASGVKGNSFTTMEEGVTALMQHLYAYACREDLPDGESLVDQRFRLVNRGSAPTWGELSGRWAMNPRYGKDIMRLYRLMTAFEMPEAQVTTAPAPVPLDPVIDKRTQPAQYPARVHRSHRSHKSNKTHRYRNENRR